MRSNEVTPNEFSNLPISSGLGDELNYVMHVEMTNGTVNYCVSDIAIANDWGIFHIEQWD